MIRFHHETIRCSIFYYYFFHTKKVINRSYFYIPVSSVNSATSVAKFRIPWKSCQICFFVVISYCACDLTLPCSALYSLCFFKPRNYFKTKAIFFMVSFFVLCRVTFFHTKKVKYTSGIWILLVIVVLRWSMAPNPLFINAFVRGLPQVRTVLILI